MYVHRHNNLRVYDKIMFFHFSVAPYEMVSTLHSQNCCFIGIIFILENCQKSNALSVLTDASLEYNIAQ